MTAPNTAFVRLEGTKERIRKLMRHVEGKAHKIVRGTEGTVYAQMPSVELGWIDKVARDMGIKKLEIQEFPKHDQAPCGIFTINLGHHKGRCKKCQQLLGKPGVSKPVTVAKVPGLQELSLDGLVSVMKDKMDEALSLAQEYDMVIKALEKIPELDKQGKELQEQKEQHQQALRMFTGAK